MNWKRTLVRLLVMGILAVSLLQIGLASGENAIQLGENVKWVTLQSLSFDPGSSTQWEGSASIETIENESYLSCDGLTQLFWPGAWTDVRVELRVQLGSGGFGIAVRGTEAGEIEFGSQRDYYVLIRPGARLQDNPHNPWLEPDRWYSVVFIVVGDQISVEVDGEIWFSLQDADPLLTPGRIRIVANPTDDPILLDDICMRYVPEMYGVDDIFPDRSTWDVAVEEDIEEGWDSSLLTSQLDASVWEQIIDEERTALRATCNCWLETPGSYSWHDYAFTTSVKIEHGGLKVSFRQCSDGRYFVGLEEGKLFLGKEHPWGQRVTLASSHTLIELGTWYEVTIVGVGSELAVFIDGQLQIHHHDRFSPILAGGISYETCGGEPVLLIDNIQVSTKEEPKDPQAVLNMGYAYYYNEGNNEAAYEAFVEACELFRAGENKPGEAEALFYMGKVLISTGDVQGAIAALQTAFAIQIEIGDRASEARVCMKIGDAYLQLGEKPMAVESFRAAMDSFIAVSDQDGQIEAARGLVSAGDISRAIEEFQRLAEHFKTTGDRASEAWCYIDIGNAHMQLGNLTAAGECFEMAQDRFVALSDREGEIEALRSEGRFLIALAEGFRRAGNPAGSVRSLQSALRAFRDAGDKREEASALMMLGWIYWATGGYTELTLSLECFEQAEVLFRSIGDLHRVKETLAHRLWSYASMGQFDLAVEFGERALAAYRREEPGGEAGILASLAGVYSGRGEIQRAIDYCLQAIALHLELGIMGEAAENLGALSGYYAQAGETELAAEFSQQAIDLLLNLDDKASLAEGLRCIADQQMRRGDLPAVIASLEQALGIYRELGNRGGEVICLGGLAGYHMLSGLTQRALEYGEEMVAIGQDAEDPVTEISGLRCLSEIYMALGDVETGRALLEQCLQIAQDNGESELLMGLYRSLAYSYQESNYLEEAIGLLEVALQMAKDTGAIWIQAVLHRELAGLCQCTARLEEAGIHYESAVEGMENTFGGLEIESLQDSFFPRVRDLYVEYFMFLLATDAADETLWIAERCRARTFLDLVAGNAEDVLANVPEEGIRTGVVAPEVIDRDLQEVVASLPENTVALEYFVTHDVTYVWGIAGGMIEGPIEIHHGREELMEKVVECRQQLEDTNLAVNRDLAILYDWLIRPVENLLPTGPQENPSHLIIIPSGPLYYLPFQALLGTSADRSDQFRLIERYVLSYSPSLVMLKYATASDIRTSDAAVFLGLADPDPGDPSLRLPDAQYEVAQVAKMFTTAKIYVGEEATESILQEEAQQASYLLIAAHGKFNPQNPMYSYLLLTPTQTSDGKLNTYEVFGLGLHTEMVVLSACETLLPAVEELKVEERLTRGLGADVPIELTEEQLEELTRGDEVAGLTRAFIAAGAASVVSSLWSVPSEATAALMVSLYTHLQEGMSKSQALRAAQLEVMNTTGWTQPWYWAAFNLMGDWR